MTEKHANDVFNIVTGGCHGVTGILKDELGPISRSACSVLPL